MAFMKMLWASESPIPLLGSWDYWTSISKIIISDETLPNANWVTKKNNKIAYYGVFHSQNASSTSYGYIVISPDSSGAASSYNNSTVYNSGTIVDVNNITWYYTYRNNGLTFSSVPNYCLNAKEEDGINQIAQELLDRIYAVPFWNNYEEGQTYGFDFANATDVQKTVRKALGIYLFKNIGLYGNNTAYTQLSDNADAVISRVMTVVGDKKFIQIDSIECYADGSSVTLWFDYNYNNSALNTKNLNLVRSDDNYGFKVFVGGSVAREDLLWAYSFARVRIESDGTISSSAGSTGDLSTFVIGIGLSDASSGLFVGNNINISNVGIDL